jgi:hypothetical protein
MKKLVLVSVLKRMHKIVYEYRPWSPLGYFFSQKAQQFFCLLLFEAVFRIRIHRIHMFLGLPDPDPLVRGMDPDPALEPDPDPSIIMLK